MLQVKTRHMSASHEKKGKYCLVCFVDDGILYVVNSKNTSYISDNLMWAPYKCMGFYEANPLEYSDSRQYLEEVKKALHALQKSGISKVKEQMHLHNKTNSYNEGRDLEHKPQQIDRTNGISEIDAQADMQCETPSGNKGRDLEYGRPHTNKNNEMNTHTGFHCESTSCNKSRDPEYEPHQNDKNNGISEMEEQMHLQNKTNSSNEGRDLDLEHELHQIARSNGILEIEEHAGSHCKSKESRDPEYEPHHIDENNEIFEMEDLRHIQNETNLDNEGKDPECELHQINEEGSAEPVERRSSESDLDDDKDATYEPVQDDNNNNVSSSDSDDSSDQSEPSRKNSSKKQNSFTGELTNDHKVALNCPAPEMDYTTLNISIKKCKQHFCIYCKKLQTKFARHLQLVHKNEELVQQFSKLEINDPLRKKLITQIRNKGDFTYNTIPRYNLSKNLIVVRQPITKNNKKASDFMPCGFCGGMYSRKSLVYHYRSCAKNTNKGLKDVYVSSKKISLFLKVEASCVLRDEVLPVLRDDEITRTLLSDAVCILFGNRLCQKYRSPHFHKMIRSKLRCLARFYINIKKIRNLTSLEECFDPECYNDVIQAINMMCGLNERTGAYKSPATAFEIGSYLKKTSFLLNTEYIKRKNKAKQDNIRDFIHLLEDGLTHDIYKTVQENQLEQKRRRKEELPSAKDILKLNRYLEEKIVTCLTEISENFSVKLFNELMGVVLLHIQVFNRRRAGEIERIKIEDFLKYESVKENDELIKNFPEKEKANVRNYVRFLIRGKLGRGVPVMLNKKSLEAVKIIIDLRKKANVPSDNPFIFGVAGSTNHGHLSASKLMNKYSKLCGAIKPETLRGTKLRKHLATKCAVMDLGNTELKDVADYMGHAEKIHLSHYRIPNATKDITRMSNILEAALGTSESFTEDNSHTSPRASCSREINSEEESIEIVACERQSSERRNSGRQYTQRRNSGQQSSERRNSGRQSWSNEEREVVLNEFKSYLESMELPTYEDCASLISERKEILKSRTPEQLKSYLWNQMHKKKNELLATSTLKTKKGMKKYWRTPERKEVFYYFKDCFQQKKLPSLMSCRKFLTSSKVVKGRTPEMVKAFINNKLKKNFFDQLDILD